MRGLVFFAVLSVATVPSPATLLVAGIVLIFGAIHVWRF